MIRRAAIALAALLLLLQAAPVLACVGMGGEPASGCCCTADISCPALADCTRAEMTACGCCTEVSGTALTSVSAIPHADSQHSVLIGAGLHASAPDTLQAAYTSVAASFITHLQSARAPAVPVFILHRRLTL